MPLITPSSFQNPLAYPAGVSPGFDPSHVGAKGQLRFTGIGLGANFISLSPFKTGARTSTPTAKIVGRLGPTTNFGASTSVIFSGVSPTLDSNQTIAAIVQFDSGNTGNYSGIAGATTDINNGYTLFKDITDVLMFRIGGNNVVSNIALVANVPYFLIVTCTKTVSLSALVRRLDTGTIITDFNRATAADTAAPNGSYIVGNWAAGSLATIGSVAAVMQSSARLSAQEMLMWAADPWSYWYPNYENDELGLSWGGFYQSVAPSVGGMGALLSENRSVIIGGGLIL